MGFAAVRRVAAVQGIRFRKVDAAVGALDHGCGNLRWFSVLFAGCQCLAHDQQDQADTDENDQETKELAHVSSNIGVHTMCGLALNEAAPWIAGTTLIVGRGERI
jgi:hypothetical protein